MPPCNSIEYTRHPSHTEASVAIGHACQETKSKLQPMESESETIGVYFESSLPSTGTTMAHIGMLLLIHAYSYTVLVCTYNFCNSFQILLRDYMYLSGPLLFVFTNHSFIQW